MMFAISSVCQNARLKCTLSPWHMTELYVDLLIALTMAPESETAGQVYRLYGIGGFIFLTFWYVFVEFTLTQLQSRRQSSRLWEAKV